MSDAIHYYLLTRPAFMSVVVWITVAFAIIIVATLLYLTYLRGRLRYAQSQTRKIHATWQPVFRALKANGNAALPKLKPHQRAYLLEYWVEEEELAQETYRKSLVALAFETGLDREICRILKTHDMVIARRKIWLQSIAIEAARWIDTEDTRAALMVMAESDNYFLAARACASLLSVRADGWERETISTLFRFPKHAPFIAVQLSEIGGAEILLLLEPFIDLLPSYAEMNFVSLIERTDDKTMLPFLLKRLRQADYVEEQAAVLRALARVGNSGNRQEIIEFLSHSNPILRLQAIKTLGRLGTFADRDLLVTHLSDRDWWIRYRSAKSYIRLTGKQRQDLPQFIDNLADRFARDIMRHALAEIDWYMT